MRRHRRQRRCPRPSRRSVESISLALRGSAVDVVAARTRGRASSPRPWRPRAPRRSPALDSKPAGQPGRQLGLLMSTVGSPRWHQFADYHLPDVVIRRCSAGASSWRVRSSVRAVNCATGCRTDGVPRLVFVLFVVRPIDRACDSFDGRTCIRLSAAFVVVSWRRSGRVRQNGLIGHRNTAVFAAARQQLVLPRSLFPAIYTSCCI